MKTKVLLFALLAQLLSLTASAYDLYKDGIYYNLNSDDMTAEVTYKHDPNEYDVVTKWGYIDGVYGAIDGYNTFYSGSITIPEKVNQYRVTSIGYAAFEYCENLTSVTLPSTGIRIMSMAFYPCSNLSSLENISSIEYIGFWALKATSPWMKSYLSTKEGCIYIGKALYTYKGTMEENAEIVIKEGTKGICAQAFSGQENLASVVIPESVTYFGIGAFGGCLSLKTLSLPKHPITLVGESVFSNCKRLESVEIPPIEYIPRSPSQSKENASQGLFMGCDNLKDATFLEGNTYVPYKGFSGCTKLSYVSLPSTITEIGNYAFSGCENLTTVKAAMKQPVPITEGVFPNRANATLYVPYGSKAAYEEAGFWRGFKEIIEVDDDTDVSALDNVIYLEKMEGNAGTTATMSFRMKNSAAIRGFQFDLYLPDGVTAVKNAKGRIQGALSSERLPEDDEHTLTIQEQPDGAIRFLCNSLYDETFTGTDGEIATLQVTIAENMEDGDYPIFIKNMKLTETNISNYYETDYLKSTLSITSYILGDVNGDTKVDVSDYTGVANHIVGIAQDVFIEKAGDVDKSGMIDVADYTGIANLIMTGSIYGGSNNVKPESRRQKAQAADYGENYIFVKDVELPIEEASGAEVTLSLRMENTAAIRGFQFDMYLPEGFSAVKNNKGRIVASLSSGRLPEDDEHTLTVQEQPDGAIRFLCSSLYDETFTGNSGEIATVKVKLAENITAGNYKILLRNMKLTETNISNFYETDNVETIIKVEGGAGTKVCAKPTIAYANGKLTFSCETEGAICQSTITDADIASYSGNEVQLGVTYNISVYATRDGYTDSDVATATLCWIDAEPRTEGLDEDAVTEVKALPVLVQAQGGTISVQGIAGGMEVSVFSIDGKKEGSAISISNQAVINTNLTPGSIAVVKIGEKAINVLIK